jgi:hypothetical protein
MTWWRQYIILKAAVAIIGLMVLGAYALHVAHEHDNSVMCQRYGGPDAFYQDGSCWMPMGRLDG